MDLDDFVGSHSGANLSVVCDLNTKFIDKCHSDWSRDNQIAIVTLEGIYILKPQLDRPAGPFQVDLLRNPTAKFQHLAQTPPPARPWVPFNSLWLNLDNMQYMQVFMDSALHTNVDGLSPEQYPRRFKSVKWSPLTNCLPRHCLLATTTVDYQLMIYSKLNNVWVSIADLTADYDRLWAQLNQFDSKTMAQQRENFAEIRKKLHELSFCEIAWREATQGGQGPFLLAATISGDIVVWQLVHSYLSGCQGDPGGDAAAYGNSSLGSAHFPWQFDLCAILKTNLRYINNMHLFDGLLVVSTQDGQVVLYDLPNNLSASFTADDHQSSTSNASNQNVPSTSDTQLAPKTLNVIDTSPVTLWHQDCVEVADFHMQRISADTFRIVMAKSTNICWCLIKYDKKNDLAPARFTFGDSFSAIDGLDPELDLNKTPASWLRPAGSGRAVLVAEDGAFFRLVFISDDQDRSPDYEAIKVAKVDLSRLVPRGLCTSPNGHLITMVSSVCLIHETAKIAAPTRVALLPTVHNREFLVDCLQKILNEEWLNGNQIESPMDVCDQIDYLRLAHTQLSPEDSDLLHKTLIRAIEEVAKPQNDTQLVKFKIASFLLKKLVEFKNSKLQNDDERIELDRQIYDTVQLYYLQRLFSALMETSATPQSEAGGPGAHLDSKQMISLQNYMAWLGQSTKRNVLRNRYLDGYNKLVAEYELASRVPSEGTVPAPLIELCAICNKSVPFETVEFASCETGHRYVRCARTLLVISPDFREEIACDHCQRLYITRTIWPQRNDLWLCPYCQ